jgi:hypothetical protein
MAAGAGDHLMLSRLGLGEDNAEKAGSSTLLLHENVVSFRHLRCPPMSAPGVRACLRATGGYRAAISLGTPRPRDGPLPWLTGHPRAPLAGERNHLLE